MINLALKMLIGNRASFIGITFGIFLATLLISQQSAIFLGVIARSYHFLTDNPEPNIWVMDPATENQDTLRTIPESYLDVVRSIPGVDWAVPIIQTPVPISTTTGIFQICQLYGLDDATLIGGPPRMVEGNLEDLRRDKGVILDVYSANEFLAKKLPDGTKIPVSVGDELLINNKRAVVVGICKITQGFYPQSIVFTTYSQFLYYSGTLPGKTGFILTKTNPDADVSEVIAKINNYPEIVALTRTQFRARIVKSFLENGILTNFALSVGLGFLVGFSIAGQIFYIMTLDNLTYYALVKALGGTKNMILSMITLQVLVVSVIGFCLGIGATILWGIAVKETTLAFLFPWQLLLFTAMAILFICLVTATTSIRKVFRVDPKILMGS